MGVSAHLEGRVKISDFVERNAFVGQIIGEMMKRKEAPAPGALITHDVRHNQIGRQCTDVNLCLQ